MESVYNVLEVMSASESITAEILRRCKELEFACAGITDASPTQWREQLLTWLDAGRHGEMQYLARNVQMRIDPAAMVPGAKSIICVADRYHTGGRDRAATGSPRGRIARYARGGDYHKLMKARLHALCDELHDRYPEETFRACVDTAPVLEREYAQRAGIGAVGKHTLLIQPGVGSYLLLGEIITSLALAVTERDDRDPCATCTRCIDACPTNAITPWSVDATRCISYLTIEYRGEIEPTFHEAIGDWLFGCDICQEVCPHNQPTRNGRGHSVHEAYRPQRISLELAQVLNWSEQDRRDAFAGSSMKRAKLAMMKRNALIVAGNALRDQSDDMLLRRINLIAADENEDPIVRSTAKQVLDNLAQIG